MGWLNTLVNKFNTTDAMLGEQSFTFGGQYGLDPMNRQRLLFEYKNLVWQYANIRAQEVAKYEPLLYVKNPRVVRDQEPLLDHPFLQVLDNPNPQQSKYELLEATGIFLDVVGEAFWYVQVGETTRQPKQFRIIQPHRVKIANNSQGDIVGYAVMCEDGVEIGLDPDEIIHFKYYNPLNPYRGLSPVAANQLAIETEKETSDFQYNFMRNSAQPSGVASIKGNITQEAFKKLKLQWKDQQQGSKNAGRTLFLRNGDFTFDKIGLSLSELDLGALKDQSKDSVRQIFRIPKPKIGDTDGVGLGRDGAETVNYIFSNDVIDGLQIRLDDTLQRYIRVAYNDTNLFIDHVSQIPENKAAQLAEWAAGAGKWISANEIRHKRGLPAIDGGDELYRADTQIPISEEYIAPQAQLGKILTRKTIQTTARELPVAKKMGRTTFFQTLDKYEQSSSKNYGAEMVAMLAKQKKRVLGRLKKSVADDVVAGFTKDEHDAVLNIVEILLADAKKAGSTAVDFVQGKISYEIPTKYDIALRDDTARVIQGFNEQTSQALRDAITEGLEAGDDITGLTARVEEIYGIAEESRTLRIAQTETHRVINESVADAYQQSGISAMQWVTDGDPCELCEAMEGTITDIGTPFLTVGDTITGVSGKEFTVDYADVESADLHPHCNCKLVPVTPGEGNFSLTSPKLVVHSHDDKMELEKLRLALEKSEAFSSKLLEIAGITDDET